MSAFSTAELTYLHGERRPARLATVGPDGTPHITPVGMWSIDPPAEWWRSPATTSRPPR